MVDEKWKDITFNIPSLLPLQSPPQEPDAGQMLNYIQALHNYLADDRQKIARAINVVSYYRNLFGIEDDKPEASASLAFYIESDTARAYIDTDKKSGVPTWEPIVAGSVAAGGDKVACPVLDKGSNPPLVDLGDDVVVHNDPHDPVRLDAASQPAEFVWDKVTGDIVCAVGYK